MNNLPFPREVERSVPVMILPATFTSVTTREQSMYPFYLGSTYDTDEHLPVIVFA